MKNYAVAVLTLLTFIIVIEFSVVMPLGPQIADSFGVSRNRVTYLFVGYTTVGLFTPLFGYLADKYGLKRFLLLAVLFFTLGTFISSLATTSTSFFIGRSVLGIGYYSATSLIIVYLSKIIRYNRLGIVSGLQKFSFAFAMFIAPIIGSFIVSNYSISFLYMLLTIAGAVLLILLIPLQEIKGNNDLNIADLKHLVTRKEAIAMMVATFMLSVPSVFFFNYLSVYLQNIGYSVGRASLIFSVIAIGSIFSAIIISIFSDQFGKLRMTKMGLYIAVFALVGYFIELDIIVIVFGVLFGVGYDFTWGLLFPVASKMYQKGVNTYIAILGMFMSLAGVVTNVTAPPVMETFGFKGNLIISIIALIFTFIAIKVGTDSMKEKLN